MMATIMTVEEVQKKAVPILKEYPVKKAILFGSYAQDMATKTSDIDLYIDSDGKLRGLDFVGLLESLVNALGKDVDLIDRSHIAPNSLVFKEIENGGIVLYENPGDSKKNN
jgi:predicted nucleotidyltransferase